MRPDRRHKNDSLVTQQVPILIQYEWPMAILEWLEPYLDYHATWEFLLLIGSNMDFVVTSVEHDDGILTRQASCLRSFS